MNELAVFAFESSAVRTLMKGSEPWFVATDIANVLGYRDAANMTRVLDEDEKGTHIVSTPGGDQETTVINESGLYACILKSRRPEARGFRKWVTSEVLPSIRKTGGYAAPAGGARCVAVDHEADVVVSADRIFRGFLRSARQAGLQLPQALRVANAKTVERTGMNMLAELNVDTDSIQETPRERKTRIEDDPVYAALSAWLATAGQGPWTMAEIMAGAIGSCASASGAQVRKVGALLRALGLRSKKRRLHRSEPKNYWEYSTQ